MLAVEHYELIRRKVLIEGLSQRDTARELGHSRKTVAKALALRLPPGYRLTEPRSHPVLDPVRPIIDAWLEQNRTAPPKQRQNAKRIHERLCQEYGFTGHYATVRRYIKDRDQHQKEVFMPLAFAPGQEAQVDWHEGWIVANGVQRKCQFFVMRLCYSKALFVYPTRPGDAHISLPGTPVILEFDNITGAGHTILNISKSGSSLPADFRLGRPPRYYDITTTAIYSGSINVCISYRGMTFGPGALRLLHYEDGHWVDCTTNVDAVNRVICGVVSSLSPFVVAERVTIPVDIDIKPGSYPNSFNSNSHGVIPVAILGRADFSVMQIDPWSLDLGSMTIRVKNNGQPQCSMEDVNGDGYSGLVCQFADNGTLTGPGTAIITLTGNLKPEFGETPIESSDEIRIVP
jgi:hypothetical protein